MSKLFGRLPGWSRLKTVDERQQLAQDLGQPTQRNMTMGCPDTPGIAIMLWDQDINAGQRNVILVLRNLRRYSMSKTAPVYCVSGEQRFKRRKSETYHRS